MLFLPKFITSDLPGKILYRPTMGQPAAIGMLYSAHTDRLIPGFGFWVESELNENKKVVCHAKADTSFAYDETRAEKHNFLDVTVEIDVSYNAGFMVHIWGSFAYLKHSEVTEQNYQDNHFQGGSTNL